MVHLVMFWGATASVPSDLFLKHSRAGSLTEWLSEDEGAQVGNDIQQTVENKSESHIE